MCGRRFSIVVSVLAGVIALGGCSAPDRPARLAGGLPDGVTRVFVPDTLRSVHVAHGVRYHYLWSATGPFAIHLAEIDLDRCGIGVDVGVVDAGLRSVSEIAALHGRTVLVAVNGDFFTPEGRPTGPEVSRGVVRASRTRPALVWHGRRAWIGAAGVREGLVEPLGWAVPDFLAEVDVIGGFPELVDEGSRVGDLGVASNPGFAATRHPRTAVGLDLERQRLWLVVVDGRQGDYSTGMTLPELADLFDALGATEALNLDGGGSSVMLLRGRRVSRPSDAEGERPVVNALLIVEDPDGCR
ncbi:MAG: phosphodiester glycosidase family protein [Gemmatimonadetes bacterium]|nr:phosphodiester glycosidase family protein [Gemmatimonadota bacterium]NNF39319.1 phosphodiester glycosidase family protein [Gemmatimonadota bacterium]